MKKFRRKPKPSIKKMVEEMTPVYARLCNLTYTPTVLFDRQETKKYVKKFYKRGRSMGRYHGVAYVKRNLIWITPNHESLTDARNTLAHEFCHLRYPYMAHTREFYSKISKLLKLEDMGSYKPRKS